MAERTLLSDLMRRVADTGRLVGLGRGTEPADPLSLCDRILTDPGEVTGLVAAERVLDALEAMDDTGRLVFFKQVAGRFGVDRAALARAVAAWQDSGDDMAARALHSAAEPKSQELIRRINRAPGATARLVALRAALLDHLRDAPELGGLDQDFLHLFASWFNRGFLELRRIEWSSPASVLEKIISYEAVHEIAGWDDLRQRVADPDRRLFAFFHPAMPDDPLIFVEVALTEEIPGAIGAIIARERARLDPRAAKVAVFYSISNCQKGLRGISFGNFLIKQVVAELMRELPGLDTFVTLSPVPGLRRWAAGLAPDDPALEGLDLAGFDLTGEAPPQADLAQRLALRYLTRARRSSGAALDPVAHFHLSNGAALAAIHPGADTSGAGIKNSWGVMVNYLYDRDRIEANHQAYANEGTVAVSPKLRALARK